MSLEKVEEMKKAMFNQRTPYIQIYDFWGSDDRESGAIIFSICLPFALKEVKAHWELFVNDMKPLLLPFAKIVDLATYIIGQEHSPKIYDLFHALYDVYGGKVFLTHKNVNYWGFREEDGNRFMSIQSWGLDQRNAMVEPSQDRFSYFNRLYARDLDYSLADMEEAKWEYRNGNDDEYYQDPVDGFELFYRRLAEESDFCQIEPCSEERLSFFRPGKEEARYLMISPPTKKRYSRGIISRRKKI